MLEDKDVCDFTPDEIAELEAVASQLLAITDRFADNKDHLPLPPNAPTPRVSRTAIALKLLVTGNDAGWINYASLVENAERNN